VIGMEAVLEQARKLFFEGIAHFEGRRFEQARASFESSLALAPGRPSVLGNLGITLFHLGRLEDAVRTLSEATAADPNNADAWFCLGLSHFALGRWAEAADDLARGLTLVPERVDMRLTYSQCCLRQNKVEQALQALDRALAIDPGFAPAWTERGSLLRETHRLEEAAACFEKAIAAGGDAQLNGFYLASVRGKAGPAAPPRPYVEGLFDNYAKDYEGHMVGLLRYRGHEELVRPLLESGRAFGEVLDLGCGTGLCAALIRPVAGDIDGVDLSGAMIEQTRKTGFYRTLHHADLAQHLAETERRYDLVLAADVFIYVGELADVFRAVRRILRPGGCFAFSVELAGEGSGTVLLPSLRYAHAEDHIRALAAASGFTVSEVRKAPIRYDQHKPVAGAFFYLT
jgi:predicted TPR repeat methyltransferase